MLDLPHAPSRATPRRMPPLLLRMRCRAMAAGSLLALLLSASCAQNPVTGKSDFVVVSEEQELRMGRAYDQQIKKESPLYDHRRGDDKAGSAGTATRGTHSAGKPVAGTADSGAKDAANGVAAGVAPGLAAYVDALGQRLARHSHRAGLEYRFAVLDSPDVNAFALPGGYIYVTRGILAYLNSEAELAAVLGHEIGHVTARHSVRQMSAEQGANIGITIASIFVPGLRNQAAGNLTNIATGALLSGYGRDHELEADRLGAEYLARTGYSPQAMISVIGVLKNQETFDAQLAREENRPPRAYHALFASHPDNDTRLKEVIAEATRAAAAKPGAQGTQSSGSTAGRAVTAVSPDGNRDAFLAHLDGAIFADNLSQGVVRNNTFRHAELGLVMQFAPDWRVQNRPDRLRATAPGGEATIDILLETPAKGATPHDTLRRKITIEGVADTAPVNGHPAAIANVRGANVRAGVIFAGDAASSGAPVKAFVLVGQAKTSQQLARHTAAIDSTFKSMRAFVDADRAASEPLRIRIISATAATRYAELARRSPLGRTAESQLRLMNAQYPSGEPVAGQKLKVIE